MTAIALLSAGNAGAQLAADRETARQLMDRGDEQLEKGEIGAALNLYRGAHEIMRVPTTGIEVARTLARLGRLVEARDAALEVLRMPVARDESQPFKTAREAAEQMARELADQIPLLKIEIAPAQAVQSARLELDGRKISQTLIGFPLPVDPSEHRVRLDADGYRSVEQQIKLERAERRTLKLELQPAPHPHASDQPSSRAAKPPPLARTPSSTPAPEPQPVKRSLAWPFWLGIGVGGTGLAVGTIAGIVSLQRTQDAKTHCVQKECSNDAKADLDAAMLTANVSNVGFAIAALGATVSLASWWSSSPRHSAPRVAGQLNLAHTPGGAMLRWEGKLP